MTDPLILAAIGAAELAAARAGMAAGRRDRYQPQPGGLTMGPCLCGDTACPSCNPGGAEAEAHAEAVAERLAVRLARLQLHRAVVIVDPDGEHDPDAPEVGPLAPGQPLTEALELIPARDVPPELGRGATTDNARELLTEAVIELVIELESEAYAQGGRAVLDAQAEAKALARLTLDGGGDAVAALRQIAGGAP